MRSRTWGLDLTLFSIFAGLAGAFFFEGGMEALLGAAIGSFIGLRNAHWRNARVSGAISGAFAGFFAGALFAGFFHGAIVALTSLF